MRACSRMIAGWLDADFILLYLSGSGSCAQRLRRAKMKEFNLYGDMQIGAGSAMGPMSLSSVKIFWMAVPLRCKRRRSQ